MLFVYVGGRAEGAKRLQMEREAGDGWRGCTGFVWKGSLSSAALQWTRHDSSVEKGPGPGWVMVGASESVVMACWLLHLGVLHRRCISRAVQEGTLVP